MFARKRQRQYRDEEGDLITIANSKDLQEALEWKRKKNEQHLHLFLITNKPHENFNVLHGITELMMKMKIGDNKQPISTPGTTSTTTASENGVSISKPSIYLTIVSSIQLFLNKKKYQGQNEHCFFLTSYSLNLNVLPFFSIMPRYLVVAPSKVGQMIKP